MARARGGPYALLAWIVSLSLFCVVLPAARVDLGSVVQGVIATGAERGTAGAAVAAAAQDPFHWRGLLVRKSGSRRFGVDQVAVEAHGSCRLHVYHPPPPSMSATTLCGGREDDNCTEPCVEGYTRRSRGLCHQHCPSERGATEPSMRCPGVMVCVRPAVTCPTSTQDVPYWCPSPEARIESCAKHEYVAPHAKRPKGAPCQGTAYRDFLGRTQCDEPAWREECRAGYNQSGAEGGCAQACPPWLADCSGFCATPKASCEAAPRDLCRLGALGGCSAANRSQSVLTTACAAEGYHELDMCPLAVQLHGGCGGSRLTLATGLRAQGTVVRIEVWWEGGRRPTPPAGTGASTTQQLQEQRQQKDHHHQQQPKEPPPINYLPHTQMPSHREPRDTVLVALRLTFVRGLTQVLGNETAASASSPRASYAFSDGETIRRLTIWSSERTIDGSSLTPLVGGLSFTTSKRGTFVAGEPPLGPPVVPAPRGPPIEVPVDVASSSGGRPHAGAGGPLPGAHLDTAVVGGSNSTASGAGLGTGLLVGAGAFSSGSAVNALGLVFLRLDSADKTEL